ncbi:uncharacterized protein LOC143447287 isoform X2 [Clavelina lepadiformis]|uniref:uncharacterized protein LOC143447287 isoform X2 n=1 Tax=Clavelina lepadiformis TaxID=159417 RepID=UPI0040432B6D
MKIFPFCSILIVLYYTNVRGRLILQSSQVSTRAVDLTLVSGSNGEDVVSACIQKLENLGVFSSDFGLMKRIAYVESNFGTNFTSKEAARGIWQISSAIETRFQETSAQFQLSDVINAIGFNFGPDLIDFNNYNFTIPLHAAVAARLYMELLLSSAVPGSVSDQATWWVANYNAGGSISTFTAQVAAFEAANNCTNQETDLWFCIDGSGSIGSTNFQTSKDFVDQVASSFNIDPSEVRTGMSVYSSAVNLVSYFNQHTTNTDFTSAVSSALYPSGGTQTGLAITDVVSNGFRQRNGARPLSQGVPRVLIVLTDGHSGDDVTAPAANAHASGITVFAIGIGSGIDQNEINEIASDPDSQHAYTVADFSSLITYLKNTLLQQACTVSAAIPDSTDVSVGVQPGYAYYGSIQVAISGFVTISFDVTSAVTSSGIVFLGTLPNPSAAFHVSSVQLVAGFVATVSINSSGTQRSRRSVNNSKTPKTGTTTIYLSMVSDGSSNLNVNMKAITTPTASETTSTTTSTFNIDAVGGLIGGLVFIAAIVGTLFWVRMKISRITPYPFILENQQTSSPDIGIKEDALIEIEKVRNTLRTIVSADFASSISIQSTKCLNEAIAAAEILNIPANELLEAKTLLVTCKNKTNELQRIKEDLHNALTENDLNKTVNALAYAESCDYLLSWNPDDVELQTLLQRAKATLIEKSMLENAEAESQKDQLRAMLLEDLENDADKNIILQDIIAFEAVLPSPLEQNSNDLDIIDKAKTNFRRKLKACLQTALQEACAEREITRIESVLAEIDGPVTSKHLKEDLDDEVFSLKIYNARELIKQLQELEKMRLTVLSLEQPLISEIRSYSAPPSGVNAVMAATFVLLGENESKLKEWQSIQVLVGKLGKDALKRRIINCKASDITKSSAKTAYNYIKGHVHEEVAIESKAAAVFLAWCETILREVNDRQGKED